MMYVARMGEVDGEIYHGIEAVLSSDCMGGLSDCVPLMCVASKPNYVRRAAHDHDCACRTWDWSRSFIIFRWAMCQNMHSPTSIELDDGRILSMLTNHVDASFGEGV